MSRMKVFAGTSAVLLSLGVGFYIAGTSVKKSVEKAAVNTLIEGFTDETAQTRFMSYATTVAPLKRIELAKINQLEMFERTSQMRILWQKLNLPEVVVRATVPVEYRYYVDLTSPWEIQLKGQVLNVVAPELLAGTPSPDVSRLRFEVRKGSLFRNEAKVTQDLQNEMTSLFQKRAKDSTPVVREVARKQISMLAQQWLESETKHAQIVVRFADERSTSP